MQHFTYRITRQAKEKAVGIQHCLDHYCFATDFTKLGSWLQEVQITS